jgi:hypothetical protein
LAGNIFQISDYQIFAFMVRQGPVKFQKAPPLFRLKIKSKEEFYKLSKEDREKWLEDYHQLWDRTINVMKAMPSSLFFIFRYSVIKTGFIVVPT